MGNAHVKPHPRTRNKKQVHWRAAAHPPPPGKPYLASDVENTHDLVTVRWTKPVSDGGSPILGYLVEHRRTGSPHWVRATPLLIQTTELTISGLEPGWRYQFRVCAENAAGISDPSELSEPITVTLQRSAITAPRFTEELKAASALENEKVEFTVHFLGQPPPKVCWFKDAFEIFSSRRIRILTDNDKSVLTIHQCSLSDEGEIRCTATNRAGHVSTKAKLTVEAPPSIRLPRQYEDGLLFEIGELIRLKVSIAGRPTPLVFWSHNGESIKNGERYEIESTETSSVLKIAEARREDRGEYLIKAVNKLSEDTQSFLVTVTDKPSPPGKARVVMALGRSVTLSWVPPKDDGGCKIGNYIVEYYRVGWNVWLKAATSRQLTTILGDLIEGSEYKFRVKAESPYGVSDPSEESETIFIPDAKRGILQPPSRGRSQPKEVIEASNTTPVATRRKKPRSQSSSRAEEEYKSVHFDTGEPPTRPERSKVKSPPKTPELSPMSNRKVIDTTINKEFFERSDRFVARELAYGSPEIKVRKDAHSPVNSYPNSSEVSRTPSPAVSENDNHKKYIVKIEPSLEQNIVHSPKTGNKPSNPGPSTTASEAMIEKRSSSPQLPAKSPTPSPKAMKKFSRENSENLNGSSEFMLVLYPGLNEIGQSDEYDILVPPPMSLSAPELGAEESQFNALRTSCSSSELLHERAMMRLYQAAEAEEKELEKKRRASEGKILSVPKIQINSKDDQNIVGLDRQASLRRRLSAGGIGHQQTLWAQRRASLKTPAELKDELLQVNLLGKFPSTAEERRELMMDRQRSESEEKEEQALEEVRKKMQLQNQTSIEKHKIEVADEEKWADDYVSSTDEESDYTEDSDDDLLRQSEMDIMRKYDYESEEEETYHPKGLVVRSSSADKPFEILTKRKEPPSPDFVPKPILKKTDREEDISKPISSPPPSPTKRAGSPIPTMSPPLSPTKKFSISPPSSPTNRQSSSKEKRASFFSRNRSHSLAAASENAKSTKAASNDNIPKRQRSASLALQEEYLSMKSEHPNIPPVAPLPDISKPAHLMHTISAVAQLTGITAASIVIPEKLLDRQRDTEEAKVVIDHYGDIVKSYGSKKKRNPTIYTDADSLKKAAESSESSGFEELQSTTDVHVAGDNRFTEHYGSKSLTDHYVNPRSDNVPRPADVSNTSRTFSPTRQVSFSPIQTPSRYKPQLALSPVRVENWNPPAQQEEYVQTVRPAQRDRRNSPTRRSERNKKVSPSPMRTAGTQFEARRKVSPSPMRKREGGKVSPSPMRKEASSSTRTYSGHRPMLREITTQTSERLSSFDSDGYSRTSSPAQQDELLERAKTNVRNTVDYITDLAMFIVACWLYVYKDELFAVPVLIVLVYRQLQAEISRRIPSWLLRRLRRKK